MNRLIRTLYIGAAIMAALVASRVAKAGHYAVTYVGTGSYTQGSGGSSGASGQNASCQVSGTITATYTWMPANSNDPAPSSALITEQCTAGGGGYGYQSPPIASASDDLGDPQTGSPSGNNLQVMSTGYRYSVQSGSTFATTCSPSASSSVALGSISVSASYSGSALGVTVGVNGLTSVGPSQWGVLIGQGLAVTVNTPGWGQQTAWNWSITGDPFAGFQTTATTGGPLELAGTHMLTSEGFTYFYRSIQDAGPDNSTITCVTTLSDPHGTIWQATGSTQISVYAPTYTQVPQPGTFDIGNGLLEAGSPNINQAPPGINFIGAVTVPNPFQGGSFGYAQLVTTLQAYGWQTVVGDPPAAGSPQPTATMSSNGQTGLDSGFPYFGVVYPANGLRYSVTDSPGDALLQSPYVQITMNDAFSTYMLFQPANAGPGVTWVPLNRTDWVAEGSAAVGNGGWAVLNNPDPVTIPANVPTKTLPTWSSNLIPGKWLFQ